MRKLSEPQRAVLARMAEGWSLCVSIEFGPKARLQRLGKPAQKVLWPTFAALRSRGFVKRLAPWPPSTYALTPAGREAAGEEP